MLLSSIEMVLEDVKKHGKAQALIDYFNKYPNKAVGGKSLASLASTLNTLEELEMNMGQENSLIPKSPYQTDEYKQLPEIQRWKKKKVKTALFLVGDPGVSKTTFALALLEDLGLQTLIACNIEDLKMLTSKHQAVLFDDIHLANINDSGFLSLIDIQMTKSVPGRYHNVRRPAGLVLVFTFNKTAFLRIAEMMKRGEFARRSTIVPIPSDFMLQNKIADNIHIENINIYNFSLNNPQEIELNRTHIDDLIRKHAGGNDSATNSSAIKQPKTLACLMKGKVGTNESTKFSPVRGKGSRFSILIIKERNFRPLRPLGGREPKLSNIK